MIDVADGSYRPVSLCRESFKDITSHTNVYVGFLALKSCSILAESIDIRLAQHIVDGIDGALGPECHSRSAEEGCSEGHSAQQ